MVVNILESVPSNYLVISAIVSAFYQSSCDSYYLCSDDAEDVTFNILHEMLCTYSDYRVQLFTVGSHFLSLRPEAPKN